MILRDAYRYQNFLSRLLDEICSYISSRENILVTTQEHLRNKTQPDAQDEIICNKDDRTIKVPVDDIVRFGAEVIGEKQCVSTAIDVAKRQCASIDTSLAMNKQRMRFISALRFMARQKNAERVRPGTAYCFNVEGSQVPYRYDVREKTEVDFDRKSVKRMIDELTAVCDGISNDADLAMSTVQVDVEPRFNINESFEDLVEQYYANTTEAAL